jgi:hypothetical protein
MQRHQAAEDAGCTYGQDGRSDMPKIHPVLTNARAASDTGLPIITIPYRLPLFPSSVFALLGPCLTSSVFVSLVSKLPCSLIATQALRPPHRRYKAIGRFRAI